MGYKVKNHIRAKSKHGLRGSSEKTEIFLTEA